MGWNAIIYRKNNNKQTHLYPVDKKPQIPYWKWHPLGVVNMFFIFFKVFHGSSVHVENLPFHPHLIIVTNLLRNGNYSEKR